MRGLMIAVLVGLAGCSTISAGKISHGASRMEIGRTRLEGSAGMEGGGEGIYLPISIARGGSLEHQVSRDVAVGVQATLLERAAYGRTFARVNPDSDSVAFIGGISTRRGRAGDLSFGGDVSAVTSDVGHVGQFTLEPYFAVTVDAMTGHANASSYSDPARDRTAGVVHLYGTSGITVSYGDRVTLGASGVLGVTGSGVSRLGVTAAVGF